MGKTIAQKIITVHQLNDEIKIDQILTSDKDGTMIYLAFETMGVSKVKAEKVVSYAEYDNVDADEQKYIQKCAAKHGVYYSRLGNGFSHQVHYERFANPGEILLGSSPCVQSCGGIGMLSMTTNALEVAAAMGGGTHNMLEPKNINVKLTGNLKPGVSAKDIGLEILKQISTKGGYGSIIEVTGEGVENLTVPQRCTIAEMGAETGAIATIFPSDERTRAFLEAQGREEDWIEIRADKDAFYEQTININMDKMIPLMTYKNSPESVFPVFEMTKEKVNNLCIGRNTGASLTDLLVVAAMLKNKKVADDVNLCIMPGSRQVMTMLIESGALMDLVDAGARIIDNSCSKCNGDEYYMSPETAAASALTGYFTDPTYGTAVPHEIIEMIYGVDEKYRLNDSGIIAPLDTEQAEKIDTKKNQKLKKLPEAPKFKNSISSKVLLKVKNVVTTDHIKTPGKKCFEIVDSTFADRAKSAASGTVVAANNFGQGANIENAALSLLALGINVLIARSFAPNFEKCLINVGILPLVFTDIEDFEKINQGEQLVLSNIIESLETGDIIGKIGVGTKKIKLKSNLTDRERAILKAGGVLKYTANKA